MEDILHAILIVRNCSRRLLTANVISNYNRKKLYSKESRVRAEIERTNLNYYFSHLISRDSCRTKLKLNEIA